MKPLTLIKVCPLEVAPGYVAALAAAPAARPGLVRSWSSENRLLSNFL